MVTETVESSLLNWANPELKVSATQGWPMLRLESCLWALLPYLALLAFGYARKARSAGPLVEDAWLRLPQILYNGFQVLLSGYCVVAVLQEVHTRQFSFACNGFDGNNTGMAYVTWVFYLSKLVDFIDTLFIIVRGKWAQLSFLHQYHHVSIFAIFWLLANVGYDGEVWLCIALNGSVHVIMYSYYLLCTLGVRPSWKKLVTTVQLVQFTVMVAQGVWVAVGCSNNNNYPRRVAILYVIYIATMFSLFFEFFLNAYGGKKGKGKGEKKE